MLPKREKRRARHARRVSRRKTLKHTAPTFTPPAHMVHTEFKSVSHPTWDRILDRIGLELKYWVHDLVLRPKVRQPPLVLTGPECSGKRTFHEAMGLLLPDRAVMQYPDEARRFNWQAFDDRKSAWEERLRQTWLAVVQDEPDRYVSLFRHPESRDGRYLKWCLTHTHDVDPLPNVQRFDVGLPATTVPRVDLLKRLEDDATRHRLHLHPHWERRGAREEAYPRTPAP